MGIVVCQSCEEIIAYIRSDRVNTLYAQCPGCQKGDHERNDVLESAN